MNGGLLLIYSSFDSDTVPLVTETETTLSVSVLDRTEKRYRKDRLQVNRTTSEFPGRFSKVSSRPTKRSLNPFGGG